MKTIKIKLTDDDYELFKKINKNHKLDLNKIVRDFCRKVENVKGYKSEYFSHISIYAKDITFRINKYLKKNKLN